MVGSMTIITTFITPYMVKMGWKVHKLLIFSIMIATITRKSGIRFDYLVFSEESGRDDSGSGNILVTLSSCNNGRL